MTRLYISQTLEASQIIQLDKDQRHYLEKVLRFQPGDYFAGFNQRDGEWKILFKKPDYVCMEKLRAPSPTPTSWLAFAPLKNDPMNFLIEKATELGVTNFQPILTDRTNSHRINLEKLTKNACEAAQQCERFDIPHVHEPLPLKNFIKKLPQGIHWYASMERSEENLSGLEFPAGFIIGPEGGWSPEERIILEQNTTLISLGKNILRAETAAIVSLSAKIFCKR